MKGYARLSKALCEQGAVAEAAAVLERGLAANPGAVEQLQEEWSFVQQLRALLAEAATAAAQQQHDVAAALLSEACRMTSAPSIALQCAEAELARGNPDRVQRCAFVAAASAALRAAPPAWRCTHGWLGEDSACGG